MSSDLRDHFFYKTDARKLSPKLKVCVGGRCKKGTAKVIWLPYTIEADYLEKYSDEEEPTIGYPPVERDDLWKFKYWLMCIARWEEMRSMEHMDKKMFSETIIEYPIGALYNPEEGEVEEIRWESEKRFDYKFYSSNNDSDFQEMSKYFEGYLSNEVDCEKFEEWFLDEYKSRTMERVERKRKRERNRNSELSYLRRGYWLEEKPED